MNIEEVREYALSLPGVTEDMPFGEDNVTFRVEGKIFLCLYVGGAKEPHFAFKLSPDRNEELRATHDAVTPAWHWNKRHWSDVYYGHVDDADLRSWITESHDLVVSQLPRILRSRYR